MIAIPVFFIGQQSQTTPSTVSTQKHSNNDGDDENDHNDGSDNRHHNRVGSWRKQNKHFILM